MATGSTNARLPPGGGIFSGETWSSKRRTAQFSNVFRYSKKFLPRSLPLLRARSAVGERRGELEADFSPPEVRLIEGLLGVQGRGRSATSRQLKEVEEAVVALENAKGVEEPTSSSLIEGRWQLMFTTRPGTASPIQRTFVGVDGFKVFQEVYLRSDDPRVSNIVQFSDTVGELKVEAEAMIEDGKRILFRFDRAAFSFKALPFKVPYPVPFRLLGDEAKGWLDTTYLSPNGNIRISRGNKGTTFVLQKRTEPRQRLLSAISSDSDVKDAVDELISFKSKMMSGEEEALLEGEWQLAWSSQLIEESLTDAAAGGLKGRQVIRGDGRVENSVDVIPGIKISAFGSLEKSDNSYDITVSNGSVLVGSLKFPLDIKRRCSVQLLYIDKKIRITRGYKDIIFIHICVYRPNVG